ncbi:MAG: glycosyltransferase family 4 protein [Alphaproteobacteria bacterium]
MPTGIDRVELAYTRHWLKKDPERVTFLLRGPFGSAVAVPRSLVSDLVQALEIRRLGAPGWEDSAGPAAQLARSAILRLSLGRGMRDLGRALRAPEESLYVLVSHAWADQPRPIAAIKRKGVKFIPLVHDLIPVNFPEYSHPAGVRRHMRRIAVFAGLADGIIVYSQATADDLGPQLSRSAEQMPLLCAPLGIDTPIPDPNYPAPAGAYFICIGTIEPRKNHLLLLNTWRVLAERLGVEAPKLLLIGRRGWENENILDMLDRCPAMIGLVREYKGLPDKAVASLLQGARALLFPSFTEGYGLPLAEALALGVPAICSDLPALREVGGDAPEFLDPLDGLGWRRLILNYAEPDSGMREAQLERINLWSQPSWEQHFALVDPWLRQIASAGRARKAELSPAETVTGAAEARSSAPLAQGP